MRMEALNIHKPTMSYSKQSETLILSTQSKFFYEILNININKQDKKLLKSANHILSDMILIQPKQLNT